MWVRIGNPFGGRRLSGESCCPDEMRWNEPVARTVPAAGAAQNGSAPEKPLSMPCLPLYGIVGSLVRFVQRQRPCWHRFRGERPPAAKGRGERGGGRSRAAGREPRQPEGEPGQSRPLPSSTQPPNQPWRRRRRRAETPAKPRPARPIAQVEGSGTATALTVIM